MRWVAVASFLIPAGIWAQSPNATPGRVAPLDAPAQTQGAAVKPDLQSGTRPDEVLWLDPDASAEMQVQGLSAANPLASGLHLRSETLPDSPGAMQAEQTGSRPMGAVKPCVSGSSPAEAESAIAAQAPCSRNKGTYKQFLNSPQPLPLTTRQKGILAVRDVIDPFNLLTITANAAFTVGINSHTAYGPGMAGFGRDVGYSFAQDATGEFIGTYMVCSLAHQDPHYHRDPEGTAKQRVLHALKHTVISQHDDGTPMPNYENFITYPASALISNLYVPGVHGDGPSTVARFMTGLATDPVNNLITEFLPDFARHVHVRVVFVQQILNQIATGQQL